MNTLALFGSLGLPEMIVIAIIGLLIFGKRLPDVGKSMGQFIVKFKQGLRNTEEDIEKAASEEPKKIEAPKTVAAKQDDKQVAV